jgi:hypothetical protein
VAAVSALVADLLRGGHCVRFRATGGSMEGTIWSGAVLEVEPIQPEQAWRGDLLLYQQHDRLIAHRLVGRIDRPTLRLIVRGDNMNDCDRPLVPGALLGRVNRVQHGFGHLVHAAARSLNGWLRGPRSHQAML